MPEHQWQCVNTGRQTGAYNMEFDESLARRLLSGDGAQTLRFFGWKPWAISLGYNQDDAVVDAAMCSRDGIDVVRRPTGGRAILHAEELTYSVVMRTRHKSVLEVYNEISRALVRGLHFFGVEVSLQRSQPDFAAQYRSATSVPCFASSARYEIEWNGRKLVGSAQRRYSDGTQVVVLQHGSILCGPAHQRLSEYLSLDDEAALSQLRRTLREKTIDLGEITGRVVDQDALSACVKQGFEAGWGVSFAPGPEQQLHTESLHA